VWQAKRYPSAINWKECEESLAAAIERWQPSKVVFCFPRDLSQQLEGSFEAKLVQHPAAQKEGVQVGLWNLSELMRRLNQHEDLRSRFFGREQEGTMAALERAMKSGGRLETGADLLERAKTLSEFADQQDVNFTYVVTTRPTSAPAAELRWDRLPYVTIMLGDERTEVRVDTWVREGADVQLPMLGFLDTDEGQRARVEVVRHLARGEAAEAREGYQVSMNPPRLMRDLSPNQRVEAMGTLRLGPSQPVHLVLEIETPEGRLERQLELRQVPPRPGAHAAFAGYSGSVLVELSFTRLEGQTVRTGVNFTAHFGEDAVENAEAADLLYAFGAHEEVVLRSTRFFPNPGEMRGRYEELRQDGLAEEMDWARHLWRDLALLEHELGVSLPMPKGITEQDLAEVHTAAKVLRAGGGTYTFHTLRMELKNRQDLPRLTGDLGKSGTSTARNPVTYTIFGQDVVLGLGEYELPPLKVVSVEPLGPEDDGPTQVELTADGDGKMPFRLVDWNSPSSPEGDASSANAGDEDAGDERSAQPASEDGDPAKG